MKKSIKLLLLAALAWPGWIATVAQTGADAVQHQLDSKETRQHSSVVSNETKPEKPIVEITDETAGIGKPNFNASTNRLYSKFASVKEKKSARPKKAEANTPAIFIQKDVEDVGYICDGSVTNQYIPVYSYYFENSNTESQWIYPSSYFTGENGAFKDVPNGSTISISAIAFYASGTISTYVSQATVSVRVNETTSTTIANRNAQTTNRNAMGTPVFTGNLACYSGDNNNLMIIEFNEPYIYNGGNLIIDIKIETPADYYGQTSWYGVNTSSNTGYYYATNSASGTQQFLPMMGMIYSYSTWEAADEIDFGDVPVNTTKNMPAKIQNPGEEALSATMTATQPFGVSPSTLTMNPGETDFTLSFTPSQSINYTGNLNLDINGQSANIKMKGVGFKEGDKAIRDADFFHDFTYTWKENGVGTEHTGYLDSIATDPDQIIAMLREVYMNKNIPGNYKRGFTTSGADDHDNIVTYTGEGQINSSHQWVDSYGWNIEGNVLNGGTYWYMDPNQYKPNQEGVTLLLLEMVDDFKYEDENKNIKASTSDYAKLREYVFKAIKSARVITESERTGSGFDAGTLFKIDCDKMNKFYLIAKGQLQWFWPNNGSSYFNGYNNPCYVNSYQDPGLSYSYLETCAFLGHMFEQFSPSIGSSSGEESKPRDDIYQDLVKDMETFGVIHDCPNVPYIGHHFMMYGEDSPSADCADVRDMLFFVPDYRMMYHSNRSPESNSSRRDYFNYNPDHQPTMGVFGIHQDEIPAGNEIESQRYTDDPDKSKWKSLYHHQLQWWSNLDEFLPNDEQYYELWEIVTDEFGVQKYQQVYYRNEQGEYKLQNGGWYSGDTTGHSLDFVPIVLNRDDANPFNAQNPNNANKQIVKMKYPDVYVDMKAGSQIKTYVIRGRDKGAEGGEPFLSLQWSNLEQVIIPGLDPNEKVRLIGATYYSRYNPDSEKNCYSNKLEMKNNALGLKEADLANNLLFYRSSRAAQIDENGNVKTDEKGNILYAQEADKKLFATGSISSGNKLLTITLVPGLQSPQSDFPVGKHDGLTAGYHANNNLKFTYSIKNGYVDFGNLYFWDNFTADVSKNTHPARYLYKMEVGDAYSNDVPVPVYKTDSKINGALTIDQVVADTQMNPDYKPVDDVKFDAKVQLSSKSEILRYDAYRWPESEKRYLVDYGGDTDDQEEDFDPTGIAQNQDGYYTVTMNEDTGPYYYVAPSSELPYVTETNPTGWAKFVDTYPKNQGEVDAYVYAPVVELFTKGYYEELNNNKQVERRDYNTYGGPLKRTALGKLEVKAYQPTADDEGTDRAQMSEYKWYDNGNWYSYYNIYLNFTALDVPAGYELYKVRAWRQVTDKSILGEEVGSRAGRANYDGDWYMYEDMNFGDPLKISDGSATQPDVMSLSKLKGNGFNLGYRSNKIAKPVNPDGTGGGPVFEYDLTPNPNADNTAEEELIKREMRATFGAKRLKTPKDDSGSLDELNAKFKVRAYFTKNTNPLTNAGLTPKAKPIYVLGNSNMSSSWDPAQPLAGLYSDNGTTYTGNVVINAASETDNYGYFSFSTKKASTNNGWNEISGYRYGAANSDGAFWVNEENLGQDLALTKAAEPNAFHIAAGAYKLTVTKGSDGNLTNLVITKAVANAPRRAAMPGSDYDYYIAEGETKNIRLEGSSIITGISGVKADLNREVVSVTYVNPLGQQSSRPFSGVNMVITRYSDGSATTTKVVK